MIGFDKKMLIIKVTLKKFLLLETFKEKGFKFIEILENLYHEFQAKIYSTIKISKLPLPKMDHLPNKYILLVSEISIGTGIFTRSFLVK